MNTEQKFDIILAKLDTMDSKITTIESKLTNIESRMTNLESRMTNLEEEVSAIKEDVAEINLTLENEIRRDIRRVAEGHQDLSRMLHEAMKPHAEFEMLSIRLGWLENKVNKMSKKRKLHK